jgi:hypothetical protein
LRLIARTALEVESFKARMKSGWHREIDAALNAHRWARGERGMCRRIPVSTPPALRRSTNA